MRARLLGGSSRSATDSPAGNEGFGRETVNFFLPESVVVAAETPSSAVAFAAFLGAGRLRPGNDKGFFVGGGGGGEPESDSSEEE